MDGSIGKTIYIYFYLIIFKVDFWAKVGLIFEYAYFGLKIDLKNH